MSNVVYLGRVPDGFIERDMWQYFRQFGHIKRLKLYRSKKTGKSKGFAFIQFASEEVAKIVASTMNNYLMFEKILKCHVLPKEKLHKNLFKNWQKLPDPRGRLRKIASAFNRPKGTKQDYRVLDRLAKKIQEQNKKLAESGINYSYPVEEIIRKKTEIKQQLKAEIESKKVEIESKIKSESEIKQEISDDEKNESKIPASEYSLIVDSSDDEISLKTPENAKKRSKSREKLSRNDEKRPKLAKKLSAGLKKITKRKILGRKSKILSEKSKISDEKSKILGKK